MGRKGKRIRTPSPSSPNRSRRSPNQGRIKVKVESNLTMTSTSRGVLSSKVTSYFEARAKLSADLLNRKSDYGLNPSTHPEYKDVWSKFYRRKQVKAKKPLSAEGLQSAWTVKWRKVLDAWYVKELNSERRKLRRSLGLKKKALRRLEVKMEHQEESDDDDDDDEGETGSSQKSSAPASQSLPDSLAVKIMETLLFLTSIKAQLGEWGDRVDTARRLCIDIESQEPGGSVKAIKDERFGYLLEGCMQALEISLSSGTLRRTSKMNEGLAQIRYLRSLVQLSPESPPASSPALSEDRQPRKTFSTASLPEPVVAVTTAAARGLPIELESTIRTLRLLSSIKNCLDELKPDVAHYLQVANTLEFERGPNGSDALLFDGRFLNVIYRVKMKLLNLIILDQPMLVQECKKSVAALLSRTSLATADNNLTMPPLMSLDRVSAFDPIMTGHAAHGPPAAVHATHPLLMPHWIQPGPPPAVDATNPLLMGNAAMREAMNRFTESVRRPDFGRYPGHRSSTPLGNVSPIPSLRPLDHLQMTHDHDQSHSRPYQSTQPGWIRVSPAGSIPANPEQMPGGVFKLPGNRPSGSQPPGPPPPPRPRPSATVTSGALTEPPPIPKNVLATAISATLKEAFGSRPKLSGEMMKKIESRVRKSIVHIKQEISVTQAQQGPESSHNISGDLGSRLQRFKMMDDTQRAQLLREVHNLAIEKPELVQEINNLKEKFF